jgi:hypothetical protein
VKRGDRLQAVITADAGDLTLVIAGAAKTRARAKLSRVSFRALRSGVAYVRVGAAATPPAGVPYELRLTRR